MSNEYNYKDWHFFTKKEIRTAMRKRFRKYNTRKIAKKLLKRLNL